MSEQIVEIIHNKVINKELTEQEIDQIIKGVADKTIPDYLITSWLMAMYIKGLSINETYYLTKAMWKYSIHIDLSNAGNNIIDKHSTGGVGDKVSLTLLPIIAAGGVPVAKLSGRGLGFTGGTIDKLESVGVNVNLTEKQMLNLLKKIKIFIAGQTNNLVPTDKVLYSLRDVTGTVNNYGLMASSILSKKFSILGTHVFLDVKYGSGAFCKNYSQAKKFIKYLQAIAKKMKRKLTIFVTNMDQPLGRNIGNALEVLESQNFLEDNNNCSKDLKKLIYKSAAIIFMSNDKSLSYKQAYNKVCELVNSKASLNKLYEWLKAQGADINKLKNKSYFKPKYKFDFIAPNNGYLKFISSDTIGMVSVHLGAGRILKTDSIDFQAGMIWHFKTGDKIKKGDCLVTCYSSSPINKNDISSHILNCIKITKLKPRKIKIIKKIIYVK